MYRALIGVLLIMLAFKTSGYLIARGGFAQVATGRTLSRNIRNYVLPSAAVEVMEGKARLFKEGNPIIYNGAVDGVHGNPAAGDEVRVVDNRGNVFGRGFFNPHSQYRVRVLATKEDKLFETSISEIVSDRLDRAMKLRNALGLPRDGTDVYRLVNGEGDGLSGLMVDVLGDTVVVQSSAIWVEKHKAVVEEAVRGVRGLAGKQILWKQATERLKQDGWEIMHALARESEEEFAAAAEAQQPNDGAPLLSTVVENSIRFVLCAEKDQKTGFYCDQRENRMLLRSLVRDKSVLDLYCYTGGFTLNSVLGGAKSVTSVDSSLRAVQAVRENIRINGFNCEVNVDGMGPNATTPSPYTTRIGAAAVDALVRDGGVQATAATTVGEGSTVYLVKGDAQSVMRGLIAEGKSYDVVVCDPPKLAPTRNALDAAARKYQHINALAMQLVSPAGGLLLSCSCSAAMTQSGQFEHVLQAAARSVGRTATVVSVQGAAGDHTVNPSYPEGRYLTAVLLYVK